MVQPGLLGNNLQILTPVGGGSVVVFLLLLMQRGLLGNKLQKLLEPPRPWGGCVVVVDVVCGEEAVIAVVVVAVSVIVVVGSVVVVIGAVVLVVEIGVVMGS